MAKFTRLAEAIHGLLCVVYALVRHVENLLKAQTRASAAHINLT